MNSPSDSHEQWERVAAELHAYRDAQRQAWGDLDDIQVARYLAGECSPQERAAMEQAMQSFPDVRELMDVLRDVGPGLSNMTQAQAERAPQAKPLRTPWKWVLAGTALAASFVLALLVAEGLFRPVRHEVLLASVMVVPRDSRAADAARVTLDDQGVCRLIGGKDFNIEIRSPRQGVATVVLLGPDALTVYPKPGQAAIAIEPFRTRKFGPLERLKGRTTVLVIVTATPAAELIRERLGAVPPAMDQLNQLMELLQQALWDAGQHWIAIDRITVEPVLSS
jgi:hypothetical protein